MTELIPYEFYNPYPKIGNLSMRMLNASRRISQCHNRINKAFRDIPGYEGINTLDELVSMKDATQDALDAGLELRDLLSAEIMRLSL